MQIAWIVFDVNGDLIKIENHLLKQEKEIPYEAVKIHGISTEKANSEGKWPEVVLSMFLKDIEHANLIVAHNTEFDLPIIEAEFIRNKFGYQLIGKDRVCTMKSSVDYCMIPKQRGRGYKYPKLTELVGCLFYNNYEVTIPDAHDAEVDALMTAKCYYKLKTCHNLKLQKGQPKHVKNELPDYMNISSVELHLPEFLKKELKNCSDKNLTGEYSSIKRKMVNISRKINFPEKELRPRERLELIKQYQTQVNILNTVTERILAELTSTT
jgi:DNA polymerase III epsilon subunit-like protein